MGFMDVDPDCCSACASLAADIQWWSDIFNYLGGCGWLEEWEAVDDCE